MYRLDVEYVGVIPCNLVLWVGIMMFSGACLSYNITSLNHSGPMLSCSDKHTVGLVLVEAII